MADVQSSPAASHGCAIFFLSSFYLKKSWHCYFKKTTAGGRADIRVNNHYRRASLPASQLGPGWRRPFPHPPHPLARARRPRAPTSPPPRPRLRRRVVRARRNCVHLSPPPRPRLRCRKARACRHHVLPSPPPRPRLGPPLRPGFPSLALTPTMTLRLVGGSSQLGPAWLW